MAKLSFLSESSQVKVGGSGIQDIKELIHTLFECGNSHEVLDIKTVIKNQCSK